MSHSLARLSIRYVTCLAAAAITGCQDVAAPNGPVSIVHPDLDWSAPASGSASVTVESRYGSGTTYLWDRNLVYPAQTVIRVDVSGYVAQSSRFPLTTSSHLGPGGNASIGVWYPGNYYLPYTVNGDPAAQSARIYITMGAGSQIGSVGRAGYGNDTHPGTLGTDGSTVWCGPPYTTDYCYTYSGGSSFTITPLASTLDVRLDSGIVNPGNSASVTISASPTQVEGYTMGVLVDSIKWWPDPVSSHGIPSEASNNACTSITSTPPIKCTRTIMGSGTFHVVAHVNGKVSTQDAHVAIRDKTLSLTASPNAVHSPFQPVTFTPRWADGYAVQVKTWAWVADTTDDETVPCASGMAVCITGIWHSGTMIVTVTRDGADSTARAHVTVSLCATGNAVVDDPTVRDAMWRSWSKSGAETGAAPEDRRENLFAVYERSNGVRYVVDLPVTNQTACGVDLSIASLQTGDVLIALVHPHPVPYHSYWPDNCGADYAGQRYEEPLIPGFRSTGAGRASIPDWETSRDVHKPGVIVDFEQVTVINGKDAVFLPLGNHTFIKNGNDPSIRADIPRNANSCPTH